MSTTRSRDTGAQLRVYRRLLVAYPRAFRERYGPLMEAAFEADRESSTGRTRFWTALLSDTVRAALAERVRAADPKQRRSLHPNLPESPRKAPIEMFSDLLRELRHAVRNLLRSPGYAGTVVTVLAIGIGANTVVFTIVSSLFMTTPAAITEPATVVRVSRTDEKSRGVSMTYPDYLLLAERNRTLSGLAAYDPGGTAVTLATTANVRVSARASLVTANYFDVLGVPMRQGRGFAPGEDLVPREGAVVVLAEGFWRTALGADEGLVGSQITLNGHPYAVIGIAMRGFQGVSPLEAAPDLWVPLSMQPILSGATDNEFLERQEGRVINWLSGLGRLAPGSTVSQAQSDLDGVSAYIEDNFGDWNDGQGTAVHRSFMYEPAQAAELSGFTRLLGAVVTLVLLIVCANIAVLQLARASRRQREIGIRAALGAGRAAVLRHLLTESLVLSFFGSALGFALAVVSSRAVAGLIPMRFSIDFQPDLRVLAFSGFLAVATALLFGLAPAMIVSRADLVRTIQSRSVVTGRSRLRSGLVIVQVALSLVLATGAALFVRSLMIAEGVDTGFATSGRTFLTVNPRSHGYDTAGGDELAVAVLERLRALPEVEGASAVVMSPFRGRWQGTFNPLGEGAPEEAEVRTYINWVAPGFFETMSIPLLEGRDFEQADARGQETVLIVNRAAADLIWPGENPIDQRIAFSTEAPTDRVVGLVGNTDYGSLGEDPEPIIYRSFQQGPPFQLTFVASARRPDVAIAALMQKAILDIDPHLAVSAVSTIEDLLETQIGTYRLGARAVGMFGILAAVVAAFGLYGVLSYLVTAERREIGIRMALGATASGVTGGVVRHGLALAGMGVAVGLALSVALARSIASMLYEVSPYDPVSFVAVPIVLLGVAAAASLLPARKAAGVDPLEALRAD